MIERQTAKKVAIASLMKGTWEKHEGMNPSFVVTPAGERVSRARILATVTGKFMAEDGAFASITLDDATDTIRAKTFKTVKPLDEVAVGDLVDVIGKVKEYNGEVYLIPEVVAKIADPNLELLRRLEIRALAAAEPAAPKEDLRKKLLEAIGKSKDGITFDALLKAAGEPEAAVEKVVNDLLAEGVCYEPSPGKIKKI
ncbi:MAG: hypothetical protein HY369_00395 [Candidatus Aenigmarchaeota archaeon]|nr:hypothetical protein [Candidatus Aenigmarchaeota archaeon]